MSGGKYSPVNVWATLVTPITLPQVRSILHGMYNFQTDRLVQAETEQVERVHGKLMCGIKGACLATNFAV